MSPPRGNKQSSRNTFRELAADDLGHRGRSADDEGGYGRGKSADYDGIGIPRDDAGDKGGARGGGRKGDDMNRDRHRDEHRDSSRERERGGGRERRRVDGSAAEEERGGRRGARSRGREDDEGFSDEGRRGGEGRRGRRGAGDEEDLRQRVEDLEKQHRQGLQTPPDEHLQEEEVVPCAPSPSLADLACDLAGVRVRMEEEDSSREVAGLLVLEPWCPMVLGPTGCRRLM
jgi:hypothetical protein